MDISETVSNIPKPILIFGTLLVILLSYSYWSGQLTTQLQIVIFGMLFLMILLGLKTGKKIIDLDEAKRIALRYVKSKKSLGIIKRGSIKEGVEGTLRFRQGIPWYYEVCITTDNPSKTHYVVTVEPNSGKVLSSTERDSWKTSESPNVEIVTPPDIIHWMKMKRELEKRMEEETK